MRLEKYDKDDHAVADPPIEVLNELYSWAFKGFCARYSIEETNNNSEICMKQAYLMKLGYEIYLELQRIQNKKILK